MNDFSQGYSFSLDHFQTLACTSVREGRSVLVCAPTGAGKTVVGEFAVGLALRQGRKAFYTTPLKALSNQKFGDLVARHGASHVGLLTGDNSINGDAPIVVMTTEVLRNMLYEGSATLQGLGYVVLDEVHYLQDAYRGAVWEEVLIHLPREVRVVALSATVSNAEEFGDWLRAIRGDVDVVIEENRPVPLEHHYMVGQSMSPTFVQEGKTMRPNPVLRKQSLHSVRRRGGRDHMRARKQIPRREDVVELLNERGLLPAIYFIFSRNGCEQAVKQLSDAHMQLTTPDEALRIAEYIEMRAEVLQKDDLDVLGYSVWRDALTQGIASHHAGLIPLFKETVEELFERGLVKVVFATETLSLGINMPAKTVVLEKLIKFTGEKHELMTPGEYTQLTGRAGRRGIDSVGHAVVLFQPDVAFDRVSALAGARTYPLRSSFRPSYNMAVNLLRMYSIADALKLVEQSFAQFIADRSSSGLTAQVTRSERFVNGYRERMRCDRGDFFEYWSMVRALESKTSSEDFEGAPRANDLALTRLRVGDIVRLSGKRRGTFAVVVDRRNGSPVALTSNDVLKRLTPRDIVGSSPVVGKLDLPRKYPWKQQIRRSVVKQISSFVPAHDERLEEEQGSPEPLRSHPCYSCPDRREHERWARRVDELEKDLASQRKRLRGRTEGLARTFERVIGVLKELSYIRENGTLTQKGDRLCRIYNEGDLLVSEALEQGVLDELNAPDLSAVVSALVYETRGFATEPAWPDERVRQGYVRVRRLWRTINDIEQRHGVSFCKEPDPGFVDIIHAWVSDEPLDEVLELAEMSPGDFVRSTKQVWDLLRQIAEVAPTDELRSRCRSASREIYRGVVAYAGAI
ncbi:MAG: DEAD/DEAH box helicase [Actinomycetota bacterium]